MKASHRILICIAFATSIILGWAGILYIVDKGNAIGGGIMVFCATIIFCVTLILFVINDK